MYVFMYTHIYRTGYIHPGEITETYVEFYNDLVLRTNNSVNSSGIFNNNILYRLV